MARARLTSRALRRLLRNRLAVTGGAVVLAIVLIAIFAPIIAPYDPAAMQTSIRHQPPTRDHILGTDRFGRDILTRIMYGARVSLTIGLVTVAIHALIGVPIGLFAGYRGGKVDAMLMRFTDIFLAFPTLLLALAIVAVRGPGFWNLLIALSVRGWAGFARMVRAEVLALKERDYVIAAKALGSSSQRILWRHLFPNTLSTILVYGTMTISNPILSEAALSFLGLGLPPPIASWGLMLNQEKDFIRDVWWAATFPGLAIMITVLGLNLLGDGLRDFADPQLTEGQ